MTKGGERVGGARWFAAIAKPDHRLVQAGGSGALLLWALVVDHDFETLTTNPISYEKLMQRTGLCRDSVARMLRKLQELGFISRIGSNGRANRYILHYLVSKSEISGRGTSPKKQTGTGPTSTENQTGTSLKFRETSTENQTPTRTEFPDTSHRYLPTISHPADSPSPDAPSSGGRGDLEAQLAGLPEDQRMKILEEGRKAEASAPAVCRGLARDIAIVQALRNLGGVAS